MQIAFVTYDQLPELWKDDQLLVNYLTQKDCTVSAVVWDDAEVNWQQFDVIILRSMWDYFMKPEAFKQWIFKMEQSGVLVLNPLCVIKWNLDKNYFDDFSKKGITMPAYRICKKDEHIILKEILQDNKWSKTVVKPTISGGAYHTWITQLQNVEADEMRFAELLKNGDVIVQQFVEEIQTAGELSLVFFNKKFSHAYRKKARAGDFRVQLQFGGTEVSFHPDNALLNYAANILHGIDELLLYARVDLVITDDGHFLLMELELIEPVLSFHHHTASCENFYTALVDILKE
jgi:glutathione synthase/RimK-type ligase-like ATP-grasp enzyme